MNTTSTLNTETIVHPQLQHIAISTSNLDRMLDWYHKVLGMTVNHRRPAVPPGTPGLPFSVAWISNDEVHQRIALFEVPALQEDPNKQSHVGLHHFAFQYGDLDELLGTYVRLKGLGIEPVLVVDEDVQISFYYNDPEHNRVELNVNNYGNEWTATERMRGAYSTRQRGEIDPGKLVAARNAGASHWELHQRSLKDEFVPEKQYHH
jgi:catechol 2,3-dioxygenase-like lactoylglutathione lyase family enzyme